MNKNTKINPKKLKSYKLKAGFTMVELLVAMSLFVVVVALASNIFISALRTQRATVALIAANNNASLAIEQIMREVRTGREFTIEGGATSGEGNQLRFNSARAGAVVYNLVERTVDGKIIKSITRNDEVITAENVTVENLKFNLLAGPPARVTIVLQIGALGTPIQGPFINLQTTVSARPYQ